MGPRKAKNFTALDTGVMGFGRVLRPLLAGPNSILSERELN